MKSTIVQHTMSYGRIRRWCIRCGIHVGHNNEIDLDYYTARQYLKFMAVPVEERCKHEIDALDTKEELIEKLEAIRFHPELKELLKQIVRRLP